LNRAAFVVAAVVIFMLAGLGVSVAGLSELDLIAFGLAIFALGHAA